MEVSAGPSIVRDRLLSGLRFLLVDEYQDINGDHYELISAVAGRTLQTEEDRVSLMVVGDDDQNIYAFDGASVSYIRQFETDYVARRYALIENYRSTKHIIDCANRVIERPVANSSSTTSSSPCMSSVPSANQRATPAPMRRWS
jgi:ATP-dependent DNA helicase RecQ